VEVGIFVLPGSIATASVKSLQTPESRILTANYIIYLVIFPPNTGLMTDGFRGFKMVLRYEEKHAFGAIMW
jgi:hypothetical protein